MSTPADRRSPSLDPPAPRPRLLLLCAAGLFALAFSQSPGRVAFDTKFDLVADPLGFLGRAFHLWDATGGLGQVQNQAVGYAFPMGPFFALGQAVGLPAWVVQRLWIALLLTVAMWGMARLAASLRIGREPGWIVAGLAYALAPFFIGLIGFTSAAVLPAALLPWAVLPLVTGSRTGSPRRAAARSGLAILLMGGVNATSALAVLTLPGLFLITRRPSRRQLSLLFWWGVAGTLACLWWFAALVFQAKFGLSVVEYTETPQVTESTTAAAAVLRGTGNWLGYLNLGAPWVPASWTISTDPIVVLASTAIGAAGLMGIAGGRFPERRFVGAAFALSALVICAGYTGHAGGALGDTVIALLAGPLAAFRNVYKFMPVLSAATALGLAYVVTRGLDALPRGAVVPRAGLLGACVGCLLLGAMPFLRGEALTPGAFKGVPSWWTQTADWLGAHGGRSTTLLLPGSAFAENTWGRPLDEPMQALAQTPWVTRTLQPLGGIGSTRILDDLERRIVQRRPSPGMRAALRRAGIRYVVARNDLDWRRTSAPRPILVRDALRAAGLRRVARFGPPVAGPQGAPGVLVDLGIGRQERRLRMIEIYAVDPQAEPVSTVAVRDATIVSGGPESLPQLTDAGLAADGPAVLAADLPAGGAPAGAPWVVSDALRRARTDFGLVRDNTSYTLAEGETAAGTTVTPQFLAPNLLGHQTVALPPNVGGAVRASSYGSWLLQLPELQPGNAFDRNADTVWVAGRENTSIGEWVEALLPTPRSVEGMKVRLLREGAFRPRVTRITVATDAGERTTELRDTEALQPLRTPPGATRRVRVVLAGVTGERRGEISAGLRDVYLPSDVGLRRFVAPAQEPELMARAVRTGRNPTFLFSRLSADPYDLLRRDEEPQLRRQFTAPVAGAFALRAVATPTPGPELDALLTRTRGLRVRATSSYGAQPRYKAPNAFDGTAATSWIAAPPVAQSLRTPSAPGLSGVGKGTADSHASPVPSVVDNAPTLRVRVAGAARSVDRVRVLPARGFAARPEVMRIVGERGEVRDVTLRLGRMVRFRPLRARVLTLSFPRVQQIATNGPSGQRIPLPVGVAEIDFPALRAQRIIALPPELPIAGACGEGPPLLLDGRAITTRLATTAGAAVSLEPARVVPCGPRTVELAAGTHALRGAGAGAFRIASLRLVPAPAVPRPLVRSRRARIERWETASRTVRVSSGAATYLAIAQNFNRGWGATLDGRPLAAQQLDGWQQGFVLPAGAAGTVEITYEPDRGFRRALAVGLGLALLLLVLAALPPRGMAATYAPAPPLRWPERWGRSVLVVLGAGLVAAVSVPAALAVAPFVVIGHGPRGRRRLAALGGLALLGAGLITAVADAPFAGDHGGAFSAPAQVLAATALAALTLALIVGGDDA